MYYDPSINITFLEQQDGTYLNKEGYTLSKTEDEFQATVWTLFNPQGVQVDSSDRVIFLKDNDLYVDLITFYHRKGRDIDGYKIHIQHLTKGTTFIAKGNDLKERAYTVDHLICNGPGSYCVVTTSLVENPEEIAASDYETFNIAWVKKIIKRVAGVATVKDATHSRKKVNKSLKGYQPIRSLWELLDDNGGKAMQGLYGRFIDEDKIIKRIAAMGALHKSELPRSWLEDKENLCDINKVKKLFLKNPHFAYFTLKESVDIENARWSDIDDMYI